MIHIEIEDINTTSLTISGQNLHSMRKWYTFIKSACNLDKQFLSFGRSSIHNIGRGFISDHMHCASFLVLLPFENFVHFQIIANIFFGCERHSTYIYWMIKLTSLIDLEIVISTKSLKKTLYPCFNILNIRHFIWLDPKMIIWNLIVSMIQLFLMIMLYHPSTLEFLLEFQFYDFYC